MKIQSIRVLTLKRHFSFIICTWIILKSFKKIKKIKFSNYRLMKISKSKNYLKISSLTWKKYYWMGQYDSIIEVTNNCPLLWPLTKTMEKSIFLAHLEGYTILWMLKNRSSLLENLLTNIINILLIFGSFYHIDSTVLAISDY